MRSRLAVTALCAAMASEVVAQHPAHDLTSTRFLALARQGTDRYRDRAVAVAEGFRPVGPDAPAMGQHWIHPGRIIGGVFDPARPTGLTYVIRDRAPQLTGALYVLPVGPTDELPGTPAGTEAWHFHNDDLTDEAVLSVHDPALGRDIAGLRIAVLHAWVWAENPAGPFSPDNWALPFARLGLEIPVVVAPAAAMALSLATLEGRAFWALRLERATGRLLPDAGGQLGRHGAEIAAYLEEHNDATLDAAAMGWLEAAWNRVVRALLDPMSPAERERVRQLLRQHH